MEIGICVASHIGDIGYIERAEALGYTHAWLADSQMLWSDCYATLALAATRTSRIRLGTGVAVAGTRPASGDGGRDRDHQRTGAGAHVSRRRHRQHRACASWASRRSAYAELRPTTSRSCGRSCAARRPTGGRGPRADPSPHARPRVRDFADPIPLYVSGFGPKSLAVAGRHGDGAVLALPRKRRVMEQIWEMLEAGARGAARTLDRGSFFTTALTTMVVLEPRRTRDSARVAPVRRDGDGRGALRLRPAAQLRPPAAALAAGSGATTPRCWTSTRGASPPAHPRAATTAGCCPRRSAS